MTYAQSWTQRTTISDEITQSGGDAWLDSAVFTSLWADEVSCAAVQDLDIQHIHGVEGDYVVVALTEFERVSDGSWAQAKTEMTVSRLNEANETIAYYTTDNAVAELTSYDCKDNQISLSLAYTGQLDGSRDTDPTIVPFDATVTMELPLQSFEQY